jgi:hypothetical protein
MIPATPSLDAARDAIFARFAAAGEDPARLPEIDQTVVAVYGAQGVIDNGGLKFFFENDWPGNPPYSLFVEAYRRVGAVGVAELLDRAIRRFPFAEPHKHQELRLDFMASLDEEDEFFGEAACGDPIVWERLEEYVRDNVQPL